MGNRGCQPGLISHHNVASRSRLGWDIEPATFAGMVRNVSRLEIVSKERVRTELDMMLKGPRPVMAMKLLRDKEEYAKHLKGYKPRTK